LRWLTDFDGFGQGRIRVNGFVRSRAPVPEQAVGSRRSLNGSRNRRLDVSLQLIPRAVR
jgi:hypothetical protein